jgi:putative phosphonate catabolism associated alcohol dehydrogenase
LNEPGQENDPRVDLLHETDQPHSDEKSTFALFKGPGEPWQLQTTEVPKITGSEILVRVLACTVCGSDLHSIHGRRSVPVPSVLGHEIVGEIVAFGPSAPRYAVDGERLVVSDRICWSIVANCDKCFYCTHGLPQKCSSAVKYGHHAYSSSSDLTGGFAEHCILLAGTKIMKLPLSMPLEVACPISCATSTSAAAIDAAKLETGDTVVVLGSGMLGLTTCAMAKELEKCTVICVERSAERRDLAMRFGADFAVDSSGLKEVIDKTTGHRGADCIVECTGSNELFSTAFDNIRIGGRLILVGAVFPQAPIPMVLERIVRRNLSLIGIHNYAPSHLMYAVDFLAKSSSSYPFASLVEAWYRIQNLNEAIDHAGRGTAIRIGVRP